MKPLTFAIAICLLLSISFAESDDAKAERVLKSAAAGLGWPETISTDEDDNIGTGKTYTISQTGMGSDDDLHGSIAVFSTDQEPGILLGFFDEQFDMDRSSYQGRDAVMVRYGKNCNPTGLVKVFNDMIAGWFEEVFGPSEDDNCVTMHGTIIWSCGKYMFSANDGRSDEGGEEDNIAAAIYAAAQQEGLCEYGDTLVLMADMPDSAGSAALSDKIKLGQKINEYYGVNSYGQQPPFKFTFMDADGTRGRDDWYHLTNTMASLSGNNKFEALSQAAVKKAFGGTTLSEDLYFERVVIVYAGESQQVDPSVPIYDACAWKRDSDFVEVDTSTGKRKIYSKNFIFLSEKRDLGTWVHEFGHSLPSRHIMPAPQDFGRISDRYNYGPAFGGFGQFGEVFQWGVMGYGAWWGNNGNSPVQMDSFTKNSARWLGYSDAAINQTYVLTPLERMSKDSTVLRLDDPASNNADDFYIIEARDSTAVYGAPETGVVVYKVRMHPGGYHTVNSLDPQRIPRSGTSADGNQYHKPTLSDTSRSYINVPGKFMITWLSSSPKASSVRIENYTPARMIGQAARPGGPAVRAPPGAPQGSPPPDSSAPRPDMDLHAYDPSGNHVGVDYSTGEYENDVPGAIASGDLQDDEEWIFVPEGTEARFEISTRDTEMFLAANPGYAQYAVPQGYSATAVRFDAGGKRFEAALGNGTAAAGDTLPLPSLSDPSLKYVEKGIPGAGNNCPLAAAILSALVIGCACSRP